MYIAHKSKEGDREHPLILHLNSTAEKAKHFAEAFSAEQYAYACGLLHDIGKYSNEFQDRIKGKQIHCDHSTAGAIEALKLNNSGKLLSYCIAGHHTGLLNAGFKSDIGNESTLSARLKKEIPDYKNAFKEINLADISIPKIPNIRPINANDYGFSIAFFIRMIYSCLVDADFLDTEQFMSNGKITRAKKHDFDLLLNSLIKECDKFKKNTKINIIRNIILSQCVQQAKQKRGIFTLTVPTGGGKTLSSLSFAINHLIENKMDRIIYVIPYTSIIEQNAKIFKEILGKENVLEHHSNFDFSDSEDSINNYLKLSSENWDIPIIVTTNVQFFESLFANKPSRCRKLHNIANSVIIFDEAQMLPTEYLVPCIMTISELAVNYYSSIVLCTATQPAFKYILPKTIQTREICTINKEMGDIFKRNRIVKRGELPVQNLADELNEKRQVLCIVNTRNHALELFSKIKSENKFHLSTLMYPNHRKETISQIKGKLLNAEPCVVVSTQVIEAGVDIDFPIVYRSMAGLDSIVQAAGRCNREGKLKDINSNPILGEVHVFTPENIYTQHQPHSFKRPIAITEGIMRRYEDIFSDEAIQKYFEELYMLSGEEGLDIKGIYKDLISGIDYTAKNPKDNFNFNFEDIADKFKLIEENTIPIIIPYSYSGNNSDNNEVKNLINKLKFSDNVGGILRSLQGYTVNVYKNEFNSLLIQGKLECIKQDIFILADNDCYDNKTGLRINEKGGIGIYV